MTKISINNLSPVKERPQPIKVRRIESNEIKGNDHLHPLAKTRDLRLDQYLALTTSEDNISFEKIMEETEKKERTKLHRAWMYEQQALTHPVNRLFVEEKKLFEGD